MQIITREYKVYDYMELSADAKETAKEWFLDDDGLRAGDFREIYEDDLRNVFPDSKLKIEFSLSYCQGDGLNIYGDLNINNILNLPKSEFCGDTFDNLIDYFTEKELRTIRHYIDECGEDITLPQNRWYSYCCVDRVDMDEWSEPLWSAGFRNINEKLIEKLKSYIVKIISRLCKEYENYGYDYLYHVDDEEMQETCEVNGWKFFENGKYFSM